MLSDNDRVFYNELRARAGARGIPRPADLPPDVGPRVEAYRNMIGVGEALPNADPLPHVAAYHPKAEIRDGLTAGIAVPHGAGPFPVIVHMHGNAGLAGSAFSYRRYTHDCARGGFLTITPDYRLAPEHPYPAGIDDMIHTVEWAAKNAQSYGGNPEKIIVTGNSTGGGYAYSVALHLAKNGGPKLRGVCAFDGSFDWAQRGEETAWTREAYLGKGNDHLKDDYRVTAAKGLAPGLLPPALLITGSADFSMPSTAMFAMELGKQQIPFEMLVVEGMGHDAHRYPQLDGGRCALQHMLDWARAAVHAQWLPSA